jgi:hypothetical protein
MRVTVATRATVEPKPSPGSLDFLHGRKHEAPDLSEYLDPDLSDLGIVGGQIAFRIDGGQVFVDTAYWAPRKLSESEVKSLVDFTLLQWSDGIGESGLGESFDGLELLIQPSTDPEDTGATQEDDGRPVAAPSRVAIASRDGKLAELSAALEAGEDPNGRLQGWTALQWAILNSHVNMVEALLKGGADAERVGGPFNDAPLHLCATANRLSDSDSARCAELLIARGARSDIKNARGQTPLMLAQAREKTALADRLGGASRD